MGQGIAAFRLLARAVPYALVIALADGYGAHAAPPPHGSYLASCSSVNVVGDDLQAVCKSTGGSGVSAYLQNWKLCDGDIANANGALNCKRVASAIGGPAGSYQGSCHDVHHVDKTLFAICKRVGNSFAAARLDQVDQCTSNIVNYDGVLACNKEAVPPQGSYQRTCRFAYVVDNVLKAECKTRDGQWISTFLPLSDCQDPVRNFNGTLTCFRGDAPPPPGSYPATCTNLAVHKNILSGVCDPIQKGGGVTWGPVTSTLNLSKCVGVVSNISGFLTCPTGDPPPGGSYGSSCKNVVTSGHLVTAECLDKGNNFKNTSFDFSGCPGVVVNDNGALACPPGAASGPPQPKAKQFGSVRIFNCSAMHRPLNVWFRDIAKGEQWTGGQALEPGYHDNVCPTGQSASLEFKMPAKDLYGIALVDPSLTGCGQNNPNVPYCVQSSIALQGGGAANDQYPFWSP